MTHKIVKNFSFVFFAQIIVLFISITRAIILPKFLSVDSFGYWEIYWFYSCYAAICCLGYNDGLYLRFGGIAYSALPSLMVRSANRLLAKILCFIAFTGCLIIASCFNNYPECFPFVFVILNIPLICLTGVCIYIFQLSNQFKDYALYSTLDKVFVLSVITLLIFFDQANYKYIVIADFIGRILVLSVLILKQKEMFFGPVASLADSYNYLKVNISVGIKLMVSNFMGMLLIGGGKIIIQTIGDIRDFAIYSFGFSITGLILTAVSAISLVLYPSIKRRPQESYPQLFSDVNTLTRLLGVAAVLSYYPIYYFLEVFFPKYSSILPYLNLFFLIVYINIKISVLTNTFFNALRHEATMLKTNMLCVGLFMLIASISFFMEREIIIIAACTFISLAIREIYSEIYIAKKLSIRLLNDSIGEWCYLIIFYLSTVFFDWNIAFVISIISFIVWNTINCRKNRLLIKKLIR